jgi:isoamylase
MNALPHLSTSPPPQDALSSPFVGQAPPLGVHRNGPSATIAVPVGRDVDRVDVALFDENGTETGRVALTERLGSVAWGAVPELTPGTLYGLRITGNGYDSQRLIMDPYARAFTGDVDWVTNPGLLSPTATSRLGLAPTDTASLMPRCVVVDETFDWEHDHRPAHQWVDTVILETHVKSATKLHPDIPEQLRGSYAGLAHPVFVDHLRSLGITTLELLPVHQHTDEERLAGLGLINHWGYNTLGFFAPDHRYSASGSRGEQVNEFKGMVKLLHQAGIEVIIDVVYNHTCEGGPGGAALCLRGLDRQGWYRQEDVTGCGNTVDQRQPAALRLILDSLRYWVTEMHVDGFRFDLAPAIARGDWGFSAESSFLNAIAADPVLSQVKLIAEPWDVGVGGYQVGGFPAPWAEWNDKFRDAVRDLWRGAPQPYGHLAARMAGSHDVFGESRRLPWASVNFVTAHDGMSVRDLCTYNGKHNEANGEENRDGTNDNRSWNCGVEGPTNDPAIEQLRRRQQRNLMATLLLSQGTPMLLCGDELGNTQLGNNNAYCQDTELSWVNWSTADQAMLDFTRQLLAFRRDHRALRLGRWLVDQQDATWLSPLAKPMTSEQWNDPSTSGLMLHLTPIEGTPVLIAINDDADDRSFTLPIVPGSSQPWRLALSTDDRDDPGNQSENPVDKPQQIYVHGSTIDLIGRSLAVFELVPTP